MDCCFAASKEIDDRGLEYLFVSSSGEVENHIRTDGESPSPSLVGNDFEDCGSGWKIITCEFLSNSLSNIITG